MNPTAHDGKPNVEHETNVSTLRMFAISLGVVVVLLVIFVPMLKASHDSGLADKCMANLSSQVKALAQYASDHDDALPAPSGWMDAISPISKDDKRLHCPALDASDPTVYGYAMSRSIRGTSFTGIETPDQTPLVFDSAQTARNASEELNPVTWPDRHSGTCVGYADGHAKKEHPDAK